MLSFLDERSLLAKLPTYVTDGPNRMPAARLYEGDFGVIMRILEKLDGRLTSFGSVLAAIRHQLYTQGTDIGDHRGAISNSGDLVSNVNRGEWPSLPEPVYAAGGIPPTRLVTSRGSSGEPRPVDPVTSLSAATDNTATGSKTL